MSKCINCDNEAVGRSKYCSDTCRALYSKRNRAKAQPAETEAQPISATDLEKCQYCGEPLPQLQLPRQYPGACYPCALMQPAKTGDDLWPAYRYDDRPYVEQVQLTDYEREHYKPATRLGPGEYNPVSKPGYVPPEGGE